MATYYATPEDLAAAQQYGMSIDPGTSGVPMMTPQDVPQVDPYVAAAQQAAAAGYVPVAPQVDTEEAKAAKALMAQMQARQQPLPPAEGAAPASAYTGFDPLEDFGRSVIGMGGQSEAPTADTSRLVTGGTPGAQMAQEPAQQAQQRPRMGGGMSALGKSKQARDEAQSGFVRATEDLADAAQPSVDALMARTEKEMELESKSAYLQDRGAELRQISEDAKARTEQIQRDYAEMSKAANEIEVKDRRTTQDRVMGMLAVAFSGIGDAFVNAGGGQGQALKTTLGLIKEQIDRDLDLQREAKRDARQKAADKLTELDIARRMTDDQQQAHKLQTALMMDKYAASIEAIDTRILGAQAQDTAAMTSAELRAQSAQIKAQVAQQQHAENVRAAAAGSGKVQWGSFTREQLQALKAAGRLPADGEEQLQKLLKSDKDIEGGSTEAAAERDAMQARQNVVNLIDDIKRLRADNPVARGTPGTDVNATLKTLTGKLQLAVAKGEKMGAFDEGTKSMIESITGDPTNWTTTVDAQLGALRDSTVRQMTPSAEQSTKPKPVRVIPPGS